MTTTETSEDMTENPSLNRSSRWWLRRDSQSVVIEAPTERIYELVADLSRTGGPEPRVPPGGVARRVHRPAEGATFIGHNRGGPGGLMKWSRRGRAPSVDPGREFAFVTEEGGRESTEWRYRFEPVAGGIRVTESYTVHWIPTWARILDVPTNCGGVARGDAAHARAAEGRLRGDAVGELTPASSSRPEEFPMMHVYKAAPDVDVVTSTATISGFGNLAINAFVIDVAQPVLVDTGAVRESVDFMSALRTVIDPADLRWIWLTHTDFDHIGSLHQLLEENERLRVITSFLGVGIMSLSAPLPMDRVYLVNPGQTVDVGDRTLTAVRPPAYDNPITTGLRDERSGIFFSADCFGALLDEAPECAEDLSDVALRTGQVFWATVDSSWLHTVDRAVFASELDRCPGARTHHDPEQSSASGAGLVDASAPGCPRSGPRRSPVRRTRPGPCWNRYSPGSPGDRFSQAASAWRAWRYLSSGHKRTS